MGSSTRPTAPFVLSVLAGIFMVISLAIGSIISQAGYLSDVPVWVFTILRVGWVVGLASAAVVLIGSFMLYLRPPQTKMWGIIILVLSILTIFRLDILGFTLGIIGGALAIRWKPTKT